jgi:hypothetical protein
LRRCCSTRSSRSSSLNLLSSVDAQSSIHYHYVAAEIPILFAAAAAGRSEQARRLGRDRPATVAVLGRASPATICSGRSRSWRSVPGGSTLQARAQVSRHDRIAAPAS